ncbi:hypothetical protein HOF78_00385 [Candidatus Woesearchaeota archaeon]|jgi:hypothetical protein|nr:hypothetical protein [Candidatus Woesearchaeota archaeon]MBT6044576.1 hypothetical protein [Candidatus Woesearchaeota archaeon]
MYKKGFSLSPLFIFYIVVPLIILFLIFPKIQANKDDTAYFLDFHSKDIAQGSQAFLWADGEGEYAYNLRYGYEVAIDNSRGEIFVKSGGMQDSYKFKTRNGYVLDASKIEDGSYLISKRGVS